MGFLDRWLANQRWLWNFLSRFAENFGGESLVGLNERFMEDYDRITYEWRITEIMERTRAFGKRNKID